MSKEVIIYKKTIFEKFKDFFSKFFKKNDEKNIAETNNNTENSKNDSFVNSIKVQEDTNLLKLQEDYKMGKVLEENMTDEEHEQLIQLYMQQNKQIEEEILTEKMRIRKQLKTINA